MAIKNQISMKVLMLATTAAMIEQFNKNNILILRSMGYEVHVAGNFKEGNPISDEQLDAFKLWIEEIHGKYFHIPSSRNPFDLRGNGFALSRVLGLIREYHYDFIHCHTPIGSVIGRIAAHMTKTKIVYTAHGFHFFSGAPLKNWVLYYPIEKFLSRWTDVIITINKEDFERASANFYAKKTVYIPGVGIDTKKNKPLEQTEAGLKKKADKRLDIGVPKDAKMLVSVGELISRKNHSVIVKALQVLPNDYWYVIAGKGKMERKLADMDSSGRLKLLGFRTDVVELLQVADLFVFPSIHEGLPVALMEAMAVGLPVVASRIRGNIDLIEDGKNGYLYDCHDAAGFAEGIIKITAENRGRFEKANIRKMYNYECDQVNKQMKQVYMNL